MPWKLILVTGSGLEEWPTVSPPGSDHGDAIDEGILPLAGPPDDNDFVRSNLNEKTDEYYLSDGGPGISRITRYDWQFRYTGLAFPSAPGMTVEFWVAGVKVGSFILNMYTTTGADVIVERQVSFTGLNISGEDWYAGPRMIKHISNIPAKPGSHTPDITETPGQ